jgi:hypothetical protein
MPSPPLVGTLTAMNAQSRVGTITVMAAAALLATACGGGPSSTQSGGAQHAGVAAASSTSAVAYSRCVRAHGIPDFPDPDSSGEISKQAIRQLNVSDSLLASATAACENLNPNQPPSAAQQRQQLAEDVTFAQCMRAHGLPKFPDPTNDNGHVAFAISVSQDGFDPHSPQVLAKAHECLHVLPAGASLPSVTVSS